MRALRTSIDINGIYTFVLPRSSLKSPGNLPNLNHGYRSAKRKITPKAASINPKIRSVRPTNRDFDRIIKKMRRLSLLPFLILTVAATRAQAMPTVRTFQVGDEAKFQLKMDVTLFGDQATYSADVLEKITEVGADGYTVTLTQSNYRVFLFGEEGAVNDKDLPVATQVLAKNGALTALRGDVTSANAYRLAAMRAVVLPTAEVKEKGTWSASFATDSTRGLAARQADYTWEATEKLLGKDCAKVAIAYKETEGSEPTNAKGHAWIDLKTGQTLKLELEFENLVVPGGPGGLTGKLSYVRQ
jgi:hypothetical protein